jgi:hypothetical protein
MLLTLACFPARAQSKIEITTTDVPTLIGKTSKQLSVLGFDISMTRAQAKAALKKSTTLIEDIDEYNPGRIYVYSKKDDGTKDQAMLYLIWDGAPKTGQMKSITVFEGMVSQLTPNFKRLQTFEKDASKEKADFIMKFVGRPDSTAVTLDVPSIELKHTTYFYKTIGFEITHKHSIDGGDTVVFALTQPKIAAKKK